MLDSHFFYVTPSGHAGEIKTLIAKHGGKVIYFLRKVQRLTVTRFHGSGCWPVGTNCTRSQSAGRAYCELAIVAYTGAPRNLNRQNLVLSSARVHRCTTWR